VLFNFKKLPPHFVPAKFFVCHALSLLYFFVQSSDATFFHFLLVMDDTEILILFHAARRRLGIKRLFQGGTEIVLNGEHALDFPESDPTKDRNLEVRDNDGVTVLARKEISHLFDEFQEHSTYSSWVEWPPEFDWDEDNDDPEGLLPYRTFHPDEIDAFYDLAEYTGEETSDTKRSDITAFYTALGLSLVFAEESEYRGWCKMTLISPPLVQQWRDLREASKKFKEAETLFERARQRAGVTKRQRTDHVL
jgi:hypothetical protein